MLATDFYCKFGLRYDRCINPKGSARAAAIASTLARFAVIVIDCIVTPYAESAAILVCFCYRINDSIIDDTLSKS